MKDNDDAPFESKSKRKRMMLALQKMGAALLDLTPAQLEKIPLEQVLVDAITAAKSIKTHEGKRRQLQYIGRLMREVDPVPIQAALEKLESKSRQSKADFHQIERWRDRLIAEDDQVIQSFLEQYPQTDRQHLRQLVRNAKKRANADTELFRYLRKMMEK